MEQPWLSENWESVSFPMVSVFKGKWNNRNNTLTGLKALLARENLLVYQDYVIVITPEERDLGFVTVQFKQPGQGLICLMHWLSSNYYKERT